ncbi:unnamed protein product [Polarella glacialis]|uniref:SREBP regulating gene protein n=1 Tax=Polarella glacialis TaxID=89957 RepID=A0A813IX04_POLGL|nr:unnamed protein product [Polarella glacialis]
MLYFFFLALCISSRWEMSRPVVRTVGTLVSSVQFRWLPPRIRRECERACHLYDGCCHPKPKLPEDDPVRLDGPKRTQRSRVKRQPKVPQKQSQAGICCKEIDQEQRKHE